MVGVAAKLPEAFPLMQQVRTAPGPWDAAIGLTHVLSHPSQQAEREAVRIYMERRGCAFPSYSQSCVCSPAVLPRGLYISVPTGHHACPCTGDLTLIRGREQN